MGQLRVGLIATRVDSLGVVSLTAIDAWAPHAGQGPCVGTTEVRWPEWPCTTLRGPYRVNTASAPAALEGFQKDAILGLLDFAETESPAHLTNVIAIHLLFGDTQGISNGGNFLLGSPDIARLRAGAAGAASRAFKCQSCSVPGKRIIRIVQHAVIIAKRLRFAIPPAQPTIVGPKLLAISVRQVGLVQRADFKLLIRWQVR
jgi:hypothetical protein